MIRCLIALALLAQVLTGCVQDEVNLYRPDEPPLLADRVALTGRVCTADPQSAAYPLRVVLLVDHAGGPLYGEYDPSGARLAVLSSFVQSALTSSAVSMAVIGYAGRAQRLAPTEGSFTRNPGELLNAMTLLSTPEPCAAGSSEDGGLCRDPLEGIRAARAIIEDDLASLPAGVRILTQYVVLMVNGGPPEPMALLGECCLEGEPCPGANLESPECQQQLMATAVGGLRDAVREQGAAGARVHAVHLAAEEPEVNAQVQAMLESTVFAGAGRYRRLDNAGGFGAADVDVLGTRTVMRLKHFIVRNINARATPDGPVPDSDGDGLSDAQEADLGTNPIAADTDGDGLGDLVETLTGLDALTPSSPVACQELVVGEDRDQDGLTDCDEVLLGTDPSLVDSDGDAMPDGMEVGGLTDYVVVDAQDDADLDGVTNGNELLAHTDPRSTDLALHFDVGYRYDVEDQGVEAVAVLPVLEVLTGVTMIDLGGGTTPGVGTLVWDAAAGSLAWQDAADGDAGPAVVVTGGGDFELPSSSWASLQGDDGRIVSVRVSPADLPPTSQTETPRVSFRERQCLQYTVRNIRMMDTLAPEGGERGGNRLRLFFAQAPEGRPSVPGPYRLAEVPVRFVPPSFREPDGAVLEVLDAEFVDATPLSVGCVALGNGSDCASQSARP
ncbi:MAG: hypothetical protein ACI9WU_001032 [Myxococcota bacterium]|jgi:hypothetical protein